MHRIPLILVIFLLPFFAIAAGENAETTTGLKPIKLEWAQVAKAKTYRIQISPKVDFAATVVDEAAPSNTFTWTTYQPGTFFWRVAAITEGNTLGTWSSPAELDIKAKATTADEFLSFDTQVSEGNKPAAVALQWKASSFAKSYEIEIWKADGKKPILSQAVGTNKLSFTPESFGAYYFRVKTRDKDGKALGDWSAQIPFSVNPKKGAAGITAQWFYPAGVVLYADDPTQHLTWPPVIGASRSEVEFSDRADFSKTITKVESLTNQVALPARNPGKVFWRWRRYVGDKPLAWVQSSYVVSALEAHNNIWQSPEKNGGTTSPFFISWNLGLSETPLDRRIKMFHLSKQDGLVHLRLARTPIHTRETKMELIDPTGASHTTIPSDLESGTLQSQPEIDLVPDIPASESEIVSDAVLLKFSGDENFLKKVGKYRFRWSLTTVEGEEVICDSPTLEELTLQQSSPAQMVINGEKKQAQGTFEPPSDQPLSINWTSTDGFRFQVKAIPPRVWMKGAQRWGDDLHVAHQNQRSWNFEIERLSSKALGQTGFFDSTQRSDLETRTAVLPLKSAELVVLSPVGMRYKSSVTPGKMKEMEAAPIWAKAPPKFSYSSETSALPNPSGDAQAPEGTPWNIWVAEGQFPPIKSFFEWTSPKAKTPFHFETGVLGADASAISLVTGLSIYKYSDLVSFADLRAHRWMEKMFGSDRNWSFQRWGFTLGVFQYLLTPTEASKLRIIEGMLNYRLNPGVIDRDPTLFLSVGATNILLPTITQATLPGIGIGWNRSGPWGLEKILRKIGFSNRKKWFDGHLMIYHLPGATEPISVANLRVTGRIEIRPGLCFEGGWGIQHIMRQETATIAPLTASAARGFLGLQLQF